MCRRLHKLRRCEDQIECPKCKQLRYLGSTHRGALELTNQNPFVQTSAKICSKVNATQPPYAACFEPTNQSHLCRRLQKPTQSSMRPNRAWRADVCKYSDNLNLQITACALTQPWLYKLRRGQRRVLLRGRRRLARRAKNCTRPYWFIRKTSTLPVGISRSNHCAIRPEIRTID